MRKTVGVVRFPGTNCDRDVFDAVQLAGHEARWLWHQDQFDFKALDGIVIPGGFSYGDYLRCGALAARSPVMKSVREAAESGRPVLGVCNGFQVLTESGLLPGALLRNQSLRFCDRWVEMKKVNTSRFWAHASDSTVRLPIAHGEGRYFAEEDQVKELFDNGQVWWTYSDNPNGSVHDIAGIMNAKKNVAALMPHPERAVAKHLGGTDGLGFFMSL